MARRRADGPPGLLDRVRWGNLGRLVALLAAGLLIAVGPRACSREPGPETRIDPQPPVAAPPPEPPEAGTVPEAEAGPDRGAGSRRPGDRGGRPGKRGVRGGTRSGRHRARSRRGSGSAGRPAARASPPVRIPEAAPFEAPTAPPPAGGGGASGGGGGSDEFF
jgi:translation initiation factor IF-2